MGIGDDTAVLRPGVGKDLLFTTDMLIEDHHFRLGEASAFQIGWKAMAVNVSDIAAMGGQPTGAVVAVGFPKNTRPRFARELYRGLEAVSKKFGITIAGGDTNAARKLTVCVALLGEAPKGRPILRSHAKVGDKIFVTGALGGSLASGKHLRFMPKIQESQFLTDNFKLHAMIDISDGLSSDLGRILEESGVGAVIEEKKIPVSSNAQGIAGALNDGEDFELLFTLSAREAGRLHRFFPIGSIVPKSEGFKIIGRDGKAKKVRIEGYDHFR